MYRPSEQLTYSKTNTFFLASSELFLFLNGKLQTTGRCYGYNYIGARVLCLEHKTDKERTSKDSYVEPLEPYHTLHRNTHSPPPPLLWGRPVAISGRKSTEMCANAKKKRIKNNNNNKRVFYITHVPSVVSSRGKCVAVGKSITKCLLYTYII